MTLRKYLEKMLNNNNNNKMVSVKKKISKKFEISALLNELEDKPVYFENVDGIDFAVAGNLFTSKQDVADYFECKLEDLIPKVIAAIENPSEPEIISNAPCQEVIVEADEVDLNKLPILFHTEKDGGNYISSGVFFAKDSEVGQNLDFHRAMQISKNKLAIRVVPKRNFDTFLDKNKEIKVAVTVGNSPNVLIAAATSVELGFNELTIANSLEPLNATKALLSDLLIPAEAEFVLEGTVRLEERHDEGPFVDLTETSDIVRQEPVFTVEKISHRKNAIWQALLPGKLEHKLLMGFPREPTIFKKVKEAGVNVLDVNINPGGCSWLHAIVKIKKSNEDDGVVSINAAFDGHKSLKHCFVVDDDIDIFNPMEVEWAMATRFQGDKNLVNLGRKKGSSLDPSKNPENNFTNKLGFDLTAPLGEKRKEFVKAKFPKVDVENFIGE